MKYLFSLLALTMTVSLSWAQSRQQTGKAKTEIIRDNKNIPSQAQNHFQTNFGNKKQAAWSQDSDGGYRSEFTENGKEYAVHYAKSGQWTSTERYMTEKNVPNAILTSFRKSKYKEGRVNVYSFVKNKTYTSGVYVINVLFNGKQLSLYYNSAGRLLKTI